MQFDQKQKKKSKIKKKKTIEGRWTSLSWALLLESDQGFFNLFYGLPLNENSIEINEIKTQLK